MHTAWNVSGRKTYLFFRSFHCFQPEKRPRIEVRAVTIPIVILDISPSIIPLEEVESVSRLTNEDTVSGMITAGVDDGLGLIKCDIHWKIGSFPPPTPEAAAQYRLCAILTGTVKLPPHVIKSFQTQALKATCRL